MEWVKEFYGAQNEWFGVYLGEVTDAHHERAVLVNELSDNQPKKILELGAGGGQTAIALAMLGHEVTMVELLEDSTRHAQELSQKMNIPIQVLQGDFYEISFEQKFDLICYFDSFGIGTDADQENLLKRIANWLNPNGCAIIEIGATWYWGGEARGRSMDLGACYRHYEFDAINSRLIDSWYRKIDPEKVVHQSLRCYTPADLKLLLQNTGLQLTNQIKPGGKVDYDKMEFIKEAPLIEAMTYYVKLTMDNG